MPHRRESSSTPTEQHHDHRKPNNIAGRHGLSNANRLDAMSSHTCSAKTCTTTLVFAFLGKKENRRDAGARLIAAASFLLPSRFPVRYHNCPPQWARWDSNPHSALRRKRILSPLRLPVPPRARDCSDGTLSFVLCGVFAFFLGIPRSCG